MAPGPSAEPSKVKPRLRSAEPKITHPLAPTTTTQNLGAIIGARATLTLGVAEQSQTAAAHAAEIKSLAKGAAAKAQNHATI